MIVRPYIALDLCSFEIQVAQAELEVVKAHPAYARAMRVDGYTWTAEHEGVILGCAGVIPQWRGRAIAWAMLSDHALKPKFIGRVTQIAKERLDLLSYEFWRIEAAVKADWPPGARWVEHLGFKYAGVLEKYSHNAEDYHSYVRIT